MCYSIPKYYDITFTLAEFLYFIQEHYFPPLTNKIKNSVQISLEKILELSVVRSFESITNCQQMDPELVNLVKPIFEKAESKIKGSQNFFDVNNDNFGRVDGLQMNEELDSSEEDIIVAPGNNFSLSNQQKETPNEPKDKENEKKFETLTNNFDFFDKLDYSELPKLDLESCKRFLEDHLTTPFTHFLSNKSVESFEKVLVFLFENLRFNHQQHNLQKVRELINNFSFFFSSEFFLVHREQICFERLQEKQNYESILFSKCFHKDKFYVSCALDVISFSNFVDNSISFRFLFYLFSVFPKNKDYFVSLQRSVPHLFSFHKSATEHFQLFTTFIDKQISLNKKTFKDRFSFVSDFMSNLAQIDMDSFLHIVPLLFSLCPQLSVGNIDLIHTLVSFIYPSKVIFFLFVYFILILYFLQIFFFSIPIFF